MDSGSAALRQRRKQEPDDSPVEGESSIADSHPRQVEEEELVENADDGDKSWRTEIAKSAAEVAVEAMPERLQEQMAPLLQHIKPLIEPCAKAVQLASPHVLMAFSFIKEKYTALEPYRPNNIGSILLGFVLVFFGGTYVTTIAAYEAFRQTGGKRFVENLRALNRQYRIAMDAADEDDAALGGDEKIRKMDKKKLMERKALIMAKSIDPDTLSHALSGVWTGIFGVICSLRIKFAQAVTLGASIGDMVTMQIGTKSEPLFRSLLSDDLGHWAPIINGYAIRTISVALAWVLARLTYAFYSAFRGSRMLVEHALELISHTTAFKGKALPQKDSDEFQILVTLLAIAGFWWQLSHGFGVPFPLNILMLPVTIAETIITTVVGVAGSTN